MTKPVKSVSYRGIYYNLYDSTYAYTVYYNTSYYIKYVFSSEMYMKKFEERLQENRINVSDSLSKRFGFVVENHALADIKLYSKIEKRGFLIKTNKNKEGFECLESIRLDGKTLTSKN